MTKTIFYSGKAVTVSYLNSAQYLGPSNPGVVFVPNPINDWEYPLLKSTSLDLPNLGAYFVATTANQSIDGTKIFTSIPEFPASTLTTGSQGVNVTRLVTDLTALNTALSSQIAANNATLNAGISAIAADLNTNYVSLSTAQAITGTKTFTDIKIPATPTGPLAPISLGYFGSNAVQLVGDQTIDGTKTFTTSPQVPNPDSGGDAVNYQTLLNAVGGLINPTVNGGCIKLGNIQIVFGTTAIYGDWGAGGALTTGYSSYANYAPTASAFQSIGGGSAVCDRLVTIQASLTTTGVDFIADSPNNVTPQPADGFILWVVFGYI